MVCDPDPVIAWPKRSKVTCCYSFLCSFLYYQILKYQVFIPIRYIYANQAYSLNIYRMQSLLNFRELLIWFNTKYNKFFIYIYILEANKKLFKRECLVFPDIPTNWTREKLKTCIKEIHFKIVKVLPNYFRLQWDHSCTLRCNSHDVYFEAKVTWPWVSEMGNLAFCWSVCILRPKNEQNARKDK